MITYCKIFALLGLFICILTSGCHKRSPFYRAGSCGAVQVTGTYSDLRFDEATEGMVGMEVRIAVVEHGWEAAFQFGMREPTSLFLAKVHSKYENWPKGVPLPERPRSEDGDVAEIWFDIPEPYPGRFDGMVTPLRLMGIIQFTSGEKRQINLPRTYGTWE